MQCAFTLSKMGAECKWYAAGGCCHLIRNQLSAQVNTITLLGIILAYIQWLDVVCIVHVQVQVHWAGSMHITCGNKWVEAVPTLSDSGVTVQYSEFKIWKSSQIRNTNLMSIRNTCPLHRTNVLCKRSLLVTLLTIKCHSITWDIMDKYIFFK